MNSNAFVVGVVVLLLLVTLDALGQTGSEAAAAAESLFTDAKTLLDKKRFREACPKLEESQRLDPGVGTLLYLAYCYEQIGRPASAWSTYRAAQSAATQSGQPDRAKIARQRAELLEAGLPRLVVLAPTEPHRGLRVVRDGILLGPESLGQPFPVDPGKHRVEASAPGRVTFVKEFEVAPGKTTTIEIGSLKPSMVPRGGQMVPASGIDPDGAGAAPTTESESRTVEKRKRSGNTQRWLGVGAGIAGLIGMGIGSGYALQSESLSDRAERFRRPGTNVYDEPGYSYNERALDAKSTAIITSVIGTAALIGGITIYLTAPREPERKFRAARSATSVLLTPGAAFLATTWN